MTLSSGHRNGTATAILHHEVATFTRTATPSTTSEAVGYGQAPPLSLSLLDSMVGGGWGSEILLLLICIRHLVLYKDMLLSQTSAFSTFPHRHPGAVSGSERDKGGASIPYVSSSLPSASRSNHRDQGSRNVSGSLGPNNKVFLEFVSNENF